MYLDYRFFAYLCHKNNKKPNTMSIVDWFTNDLNAEERTLTRDLLSVAVADKEFCDEEKSTIMEICQIEGISTTELMDSIRDQYSNAKLIDTLEDKKRYLLHLIRMMMSDGKYYAIELHVIAVISRRIDILPLQLISFILDEVNVGHISREEGVTVIEDIAYILRGYENFDGKLRSLGAEIKKAESEREIEKFTFAII